jgi:hypothetical protein
VNDECNEGLSCWAEEDRMICRSGGSVNGRCTSEGQCEEGATCQNNPEACSQFDLERCCLPPGSVGDPCGANWHCEEALGCVNSACAEVGAEGEPCDTMQSEDGGDELVPVCDEGLECVVSEACPAEIGCCQGNGAAPTDAGAPPAADPAADAGAAAME